MATGLENNAEKELCDEFNIYMYNAIYKHKLFLRQFTTLFFVWAHQTDL